MIDRENSLKTENVQVLQDPGRIRMNENVEKSV